jgi:hypothetical protein
MAWRRPVPAAAAAFDGSGPRENPPADELLRSVHARGQTLKRNSTTSPSCIT